MFGGYEERQALCRLAGTIMEKRFKGDLEFWPKKPESEKDKEKSKEKDKDGDEELSMVKS